MKQLLRCGSGVAREKIRRHPPPSQRPVVGGSCEAEAKNKHRGSRFDALLVVRVGSSKLSSLPYVLSRQVATGHDLSRCTDAQLGRVYRFQILLSLPVRTHYCGKFERCGTAVISSHGQISESLFLGA